MINIKSFVLTVEAEARFEGHGGAVIFPHKGKSIHNLKLQIVLFVCTHNINKMFCILK